MSSIHLIWHVWRLVQTLFTAHISTCRSRKSTGGTYNINEGCIPHRWATSTALALCMLTHWHGSLGHWGRMEPLLALLVTPVPFLLSKVKSCAVKRIQWARRRGRSAYVPNPSTPTPLFPLTGLTLSTAVCTESCVTSCNSQHSSTTNQCDQRCN